VTNVDAWPASSRSRTSEPIILVMSPARPPRRKKKAKSPHAVRRDFALPATDFECDPRNRASAVAALKKPDEEAAQPGVN
jgi:hypothetical protein